MAMPAITSLLAIMGCVVDYHLQDAARAATVRAAAQEAWTDTGIEVAAGDRLEIEYVDGLWSPWPGGSYDAVWSGGDPRCDCNVLMGVSHAALIGRVGGGAPFLVGSRWESRAGESGRLFLGINDTRLGDNSGWLEVRVTVGR